MHVSESSTPASFGDNDDIKQRLHALLIRNTIIKQVMDRIVEAGGKMYLVGGTARDIIWGIPLHDIDIEIHKVSLEHLSEILREHGHVDMVGKAYGVLKLHNAKYRHIDWSIPRSDESGRKPTVHVDPNMSIEHALRRRDLTMNAIAIDVYEQVIHDPFDGMQDMAQRTLRAPDIQRFIEDPLRFFRVMQFIGRFDMYPDVALQKLCKTMNISDVSQNRIADEFEKLLCFSPRPSRGFYWLDALGRLEEIMPELARTKDTPQSPYWHPEGSVFTHTMEAVDAGAYTVVPTKDERILLLWGLVCHDLGKVEKTVIASDGRISSHGHEEAGVPLAASMLTRIMQNKTIIEGVKKLTKNHMAPGVYPRTGAKDPAYKWLAHNIQPLNLFLLACLTYADHRGRNGQSGVPLARPIEEVDLFMQRAQELGVLYGPEEPLLTGGDFRDCGLSEGPRLGELAKRSYEIQINEDVKDKEQLKEMTCAAEGVSYTK